MALPSSACAVHVVVSATLFSMWLTVCITTSPFECVLSSLLRHGHLSEFSNSLQPLQVTGQV